MSSRIRSRSKDDGKWRICLDYDGTVFDGHTGGVNQDKTPMSSENACWFSAMLRKWMESGHYVAIVTRGTRDGLVRYLNEIQINCVEIDDSLKTNITNEQIVYVYGATRDIDINPNASYQENTNFWRHRDTEHWAQKKVQLVNNFIEATNGNPERMVFADDTKLNVTEMKKTYNRDNCIHATYGDYKKTFREVDDRVDMSEGKDRFFAELNHNCYNWKRLAVKCIGAACGIAAIAAMKTSGYFGGKTKQKRKRSKKHTRKTKN